MVVRRLAHLLARMVAVFLVTATVCCWIYNAATAGRRYPPPGLHYVQTLGYLTRYDEWGTAGTPVVLVHGAFESADTWQPTAQLLARRHRVYALDLVGFGYTQRHGHYTMDTARTRKLSAEDAARTRKLSAEDAARTRKLSAEDDQVRQLLAFLDAFDLRQPLLVAHSSGAAIAAEAVLRAPGRAGGLMLLDGDALPTGAGQRSPVRFLVIPPYRVTLLRLGLGSDWLIRTVYQRACGPACPRLTAAGVDAWRRPFEVAGAEQAAWAQLDQGVPGVSPARLAGLARLPLPKAVVFGAEDEVFSKDSAAQTASRIGAPPPVLIPGARHLTMISNPDAVAGAVESLAARASP
jgi:pimeloyl-ACP methyl ester carboxylesterase